MKRVRLTISGDVQGIYYRAFVKERASELGLTGYVKNLPGGKVEVVVEGHELKIEKLLEYCKQGPVGAKIEKVEGKTEPYKCEFKEFRVKY